MRFRIVESILGSSILSRRCSFEQKGGPTLPGERFKMDTPTIAANRRQILIPTESIVKIASVPTCHKWMVDVLWDGQPLTMFVLDLSEDEIKAQSARA